MGGGATPGWGGIVAVLPGSLTGGGWLLGSPVRGSAVEGTPVEGVGVDGGAGVEGATDGSVRGPEPGAAAPVWPSADPALKASTPRMSDAMRTTVM
jgi:hypothetical protein